MTGYLSPDGILHPCESYGHLDLSAELCESLYGENFMSRLDSEDYLLKKGYLTIQARGMYMLYNESIQLTEKQLEWLGNNHKSLNDPQKESISEIILEQQRPNIRKQIKEGNF